MAIQDKWLWCNKCQTLAFGGTTNLGKCAAGGNHDHTGSGDYALVNNDPSVPGQNNWRYCKKCQSLAFAGNADLGPCPAGGKHDHTGSGDYTLLGAGSGASGQTNWRWCNKCQQLCFAGSADLGACPAGGKHDHAGSGNYLLPQVQDCSSLHAQVSSLEKQISDIQSSPGYLSGGKPDPEMLGEVKQLQAQLAPLAKAYTACENVKTTLEQDLRLLPGAHHFGPMPFYIIGHNTNTIAEVNEALNQGANAVEIDVTAYSKDLQSLCIDHAGLTGNGPGGDNAPALDAFLHDLRKVADARPELAMVSFDIKPPAAKADLGVKLINSIRNILTKDSFLPVILSVGSLTDSPSEGDVFSNIHQDYRSRECYMVDEQDDMQGVADFFLNQLHVDHFGYGNGTSFPLGDEGSAGYRTHIELACWKRAAQGQPCYVQPWTVNSVTNLSLYLSIGVNGMISDPNGIQRVRDLLQLPNFSSKYRLARRTDNPAAPDNFEYALKVITNDMGSAGTDANITFTLNGAKGSASTTWNTNYNARMEQGQTNFVVLHAPDLGALQSVSVTSDMTGNGPGWNLHQIIVSSKRYGVSKTATFDTWIENTSPVTRNLV